MLLQLLSVHRISTEKLGQMCSFISSPKHNVVTLQNGFDHAHKTLIISTNVHLCQAARCWKGGRLADQAYDHQSKYASERSCS